MKILLIFLFITFSTYSQQDGMVLIEGKEEHYVKTNDSLSKATLKEFEETMKEAEVNYQPRLRKIKSIDIVQEDRDFVADIYKGTIRINYYLYKFPYTKRVAILQQLGINQGLELVKGDGPSILMRFRVNDKNEEAFKKQASYNAVLYKLKQRLED